MQSVLISALCKVSLLFSASYAKCPYCVVLHVQSFLIVYSYASVLVNYNVFVHIFMQTLAGSSCSEPHAGPCHRGPGTELQELAEKVANSGALPLYSAS